MEESSSSCVAVAPISHFSRHFLACERYLRQVWGMTIDNEIENKLRTPENLWNSPSLLVSANCRRFLPHYDSVVLPHWLDPSIGDRKIEISHQKAEKAPFEKYQIRSQSNEFCRRWERIFFVSCWGWKFERNFSTTFKSNKKQNCRIPCG